MTDFNVRAEVAVEAANDLAGMPIDKLVERANKALADKEWPTAALLFKHASIKAMHLSTHAMEQEVNLMRRSLDGSQER